MLLVLKVYETCDLSVCPARNIFFNFMYILYINFRKISNFKPHELASLFLQSFLYLGLMNLKCKTRSLTGALLGLVTPNCTDFDHKLSALYSILLSVNQPSVGFIISIILLFAYVSLVLFTIVGQSCQSLSIFGSLFNIHARTPIGGLVTLPGVEPGHSTVKAW